jgi:hypothetical protein
LAEEIDRLVQARFPDKDPLTGDYRPEDKRYVELIKKHMLHRCGRKCRPKGWTHVQCKDGFPFPPCEKTHATPGGWIMYRRDTEEDARVVPHNKWILLELDCHYCRKVASLRKILRYLMKYLHKGPDTASSAVKSAKKRKALAEAGGAKDEDEIKQYQYERSVTASEAGPSAS